MKIVFGVKEGKTEPRGKVTPMNTPTTEMHFECTALSEKLRSPGSAVGALR